MSSLLQLIEPQPVFLTGDPDVRPHTDGSERWTFLSRVGFRDASGHEWWTEVPFVGDGLSIPAPLRVVLGHSFRSDFIRSGALHDYYYKNWAKAFGHTGKLAGLARREVDRMFYEALLTDGVDKARALTIYWGVRIGGWYPWRRHSQRKETNE